MVCTPSGIYWDGPPRRAMPHDGWNYVELIVVLSPVRNGTSIYILYINIVLSIIFVIYLCSL